MSEWISVNINDRYAVNRVGEVKNLETNKKLNPSFNKAGYRVVSLGISADEAHRQRKTSRAMCTNNYPLVDMGITRSDCIHIINQAGWPVPPRSSCIMCGLQSDGEFYKLQYRSPHDWQRLIEIEREIHRTRPDVFIHKTCRPIDEVFV